MKNMPPTISAEMAMMSVSLEFESYFVMIPFTSISRRRAVRSVICVPSDTSHRSNSVITVSLSRFEVSSLRALAYPSGVSNEFDSL